MVVGLLGLQGAFLDHIPHLKRLGVSCEIVRNQRALERVDRLILPGGESTVMTKFLLETGMDLTLKRLIGYGLPVWGICAGAILLCHKVDDQPGLLDELPVCVTRNAYGRQVASDSKPIDIPIFNQAAYSAHFIRAPKIELINSQILVYSVLEADPVFIQHDNIMATTFHPELNNDDLFHDFFLNL